LFLVTLSSFERFINMKLNAITGFLAASAIGLTALVSACVPSPTTPQTSNALLAKPDSLRITAITDTEWTLFQLVCGCGFALKLDSVTGDKTAILFKGTLPVGDTAQLHSVGFFAAPGTPSGSYSANFVFSDGFPTDTFDTTVHVFMTLP
jgi:hypothetical protein